MGWMQARPDLQTIAVLLMFLIASVVGDNISYAQTRLFVRAVDSVKNPTITLGLICADAIISLTIFLLCFTLSRASAYLFVVIALGVPNLSADKQFLLEPTAATLRQYNAPVSVRGRVSDPLVLTGLILHAEEPEVREKLIRGMTVRIAQLNEKWSPLISTKLVGVACPKGTEGDRPLTDTVQLVQDALLRMRDGNAAPSATELKSDILNYEVQALNRTCPFHIASMHFELPSRDALRIAGPANVLSAALERTLFDAYQAVSFKLSPYISVRPFNDEAFYMESVIGQTQQTFLGLTSVNQARYDFLNEFKASYDPNVGPRLRVPFSPMLASSLMTSAFFLLYVLIIFGSSLWAFTGRLVNRSLVTLNFQEAPFSSLALTLSAVSVACFALLGLMLEVWRAVL